jgi:hypothetical protein
VWIDSTTCELDRLASTPETIGTPGTALGYCLQDFAALIVWSGAVHGQLQYRWWHGLQDCGALELWSVASSRAPAMLRVALSISLPFASILVGGQSTGSFSTEVGAVSKTALYWCFGRWPVHGHLQHLRWRSVRNGVVLVLWSMASSLAASVPKVALCPRLRALPIERTPIK